MRFGSHSGASDAQGRFDLRGLAPVHNLPLLASRPGWLPGQFGQLSPENDAVPLDVVEGQQIAGIVLRLWRSAVIQGDVRDSAGDPYVGATVCALRQVWPGGRPGFIPAARAATDDRGVFRLSGLTPGRYVVEVPAAARRGSEPTGVPTTFFPSVTSTAAAQFIDLKSGEEASGISIRLAFRTGYAVSGRLLPINGGAGGVTVHLRPADDASGVDMLTTESEDNGLFAFPSVPPGSYRILAVRFPDGGAARQNAHTAFVDRTAIPALVQEPTVWGEALVTVATEPPSPVSVPLRFGAHLGGRILIDGRPPDPNAEAAGLAGSPILVQTSRPEDLDTMPLSLLLSDGRFSHPAGLAGTVTDEGGHVRSDATVHLIPAARSLWSGPGASIRVRETTSVRGARFSFSNVWPGEYFVVARLGGAEADWRDPESLTALAAFGEKVHIGAGDRVELQLTARQ